jgi:hypothetical protein
MRFRWVFLIQITIGMGAPVVARLVWSSSHSIWSGYGAVFAVPVAAVAVSIAAVEIRGVDRRGEAVRGVLLRRRQRARALVDSADKLRALAPLAAGIFTLCSFPAVFLALVASPSAGGVSLPPAADARLQLWCIAAGVLIAIVGVDCWYGPGISVRALAADGFIVAEVGFTVALAATPPLMIFLHVESRGVWLWLVAVQFGWPFAGPIACAVVSERRKRRDRAKVLLERLAATVTVSGDSGWR